MLDTLLKNEFLVMALDALMHMGGVVVLAVIILLACKLLSRGHVDAKLLTSLLIATVLVVVRVSLLNHIGRLLPSSQAQTQEMAIIGGLYITTFILVYKFITIPALGTALSAAAIVFAQLSLANYVPQLSLKWMPEGQRFAEYTGLANERTQSLMAEAKAFRKRSGGIQHILSNALNTIQFFTSDDEQAQLSKDFAAGISVYKERKAYMDNMTPEELASYRKAMSAFLDEQGLQENRHSLSHLKNANPEDLENLATFMKDMNKSYGFTDELPKNAEITVSNSSPPSVESLAKIAQSLSKVEMNGNEMAQLNNLLSKLGIHADSAMASMAQTRNDLSEIRDITQKMATDFKDNIANSPPSTAAHESNLANLPNNSVEQSSANGEPELRTTPDNAVITTDTIGSASSTANEVATPKKALEINYFKVAELSPIVTEQSIVMIPNDSQEAHQWRAVSMLINIDAWFASAGESERSTIFIEGNALQDGDIWEHSDKDGYVYRFAFKGIEDNLITLVALERIASNK